KDDEFIIIKNNHVFPYDRMNNFLEESSRPQKTSIDNQLTSFLNANHYFEISIIEEKDYEDRLWMSDARFRLLSLALYYNQIAYDLAGIANTQLMQRLISKNSVEIWQELVDPYEKARQKISQVDKIFRPGKAEFTTRIEMDNYARFMEEIYRTIPPLSLSNFINSLESDVKFITTKRGNSSERSNYVDSFFNGIAFQHNFYRLKWTELRLL